MEFEIDGNVIDTDPEGYLRDLSLWSEGLANAIAAKEGLSLTQNHWEVIGFLRQGFAESGTVPNIRLMQKAMTKEYGPEKGNSKYLYELFPYGPAKQGCRIAGLPKPTGCV
ncbi:MAG: TusE/DsrC/DsvC family sulfur relay protein [Sulfuricella sp.]|nr:TusE/DsrC/DsvC family sulfur relay protein [Sulfuricella sp.]